AVVIAAGVGAGDGVGMPRALGVVVAIGVGAVCAALAGLVADHCAADAADDGARGLVAVSGDSAAEQRTDGAAGDRRGDAVGVLLFAARLSERERRNESRRGDAGDEQVVAHVLRLLRGMHILLVRHTMHLYFGLRQLIP